MPYDQIHPEDPAAAVINVARSPGLSERDIHRRADAADRSDPTRTSRFSPPTQPTSWATSRHEPRNTLARASATISN